jgi:hypothetical protein
MLELLGPVFALLRLIHALTGVLLVAGLLGRWVALQHAEHAARAGDPFRRLRLGYAAAVNA